MFWMFTFDWNMKIALRMLTAATAMKYRRPSVTKIFTRCEPRACIVVS